MTLPPDVFTKLAKYDTPTICNVIELFGIRPDTEGFMDGRIRAAFPEMPPMVGLATTAAFRSASTQLGGDTYGSLETQLHQISSLDGPAIVVFQDLDDPAVGATFGEVMCSVYRAFGARGLITSGGGRDLAQVQAIGFPVFTGSTICSHAYSQIVEVGRPVRVGGLVVRPGDLLHGDANGVTNIPPEIAREVADATEEFIAAERVLIDYAQSAGEKTIAKMMDCRSAMAELIAKLKARVSRKSC